MKVTVATAEPYGFYHLRGALQQALEQASINVTHLIPKISAAASAPNDYFNLSEDLNIIQSSDVVIITGGALTYWTSKVGEMANQFGVPVVFLEVAYMSAEKITEFYVPILHSAYVADLESKNIIERHFRLPEYKINVVGLPLLDDTPNWEPPQNKLVTFGSRVTQDLPDKGEILFDWADLLISKGWNVQVGLHPQENPEHWKKYHVINNRTVDVAAKSDLFITYPGTILKPLGVMNIPVIVPMNEPWLEHMVPYHFFKTAYLIYEDDFLHTVNNVYKEIPVLLNVPKYEHSKIFVSFLVRLCQK